MSPDIVSRIKSEVGRELRWREYSTSGLWVGKAIAQILNLDPEDDKEAVKAAIKRLLKTKILKSVLGMDPFSRREKAFVVAAEDEVASASNLND